MTLAKPTGIPLIIHVNNVQNELGCILAMRPFLHEKYSHLTNNDLTTLCNQSVQWHDEGKKHKTWQDACARDFEVYHSLKDKTKFRAENLRKAQLRHEMASLVQTEKANLPTVVKVAIAAHHGKLNHRDKDRWKNDDGGRFASLWKYFENEQDIDCEPENEFEAKIRSRYEYSAIRSLLQLADHRASAREEGEILPCFEPFIYTFPHPKPRGVQNVIKDIQDLSFAILRAPTGAGKTDACLLWAKHQIDSSRADRLVIAMPTRFTANSLAISVAESLGSTGLYHSTSYYQLTKNQILTEEKKRFISKEQELARLLCTPITVTTIDHLCMCLTGTREEHHTTFFNLANSCLVIDEADFYDSFTQENIIVLLSALRILKVPVLLMSATIPDALISVYEKSGNPVEKIFDVQPELTLDVSLSITKIEDEKPKVTIGQRVSAEIAEDIDDLLKTALQQPTIIYANTVRRAQMYYWYLKQFTDDIVIYHSRFTEPDKAKKEEKLLAMMGKVAWEKEQAHGIAILTQIGEISVNISANCMISEWCPIDRLIQRIGRLARFEEIPQVCNGVLHLIEPLKNNIRYPAPYGSFQSNKGWTESPYLTATFNKFTDISYTKTELLKLVNEVYNSALLITPEATANAYEFRNLIKSNWLILPAWEAEQEDTAVQNWKSRDIGSQSMIYYEGTWELLSDDSVTSFKNTRERREFDITNGINIPTWELHQADEDGKISKRNFQIGLYDLEDLWVINNRKYYDSFGVGLCFNPPSNDFD